jgi:murein DD-endopeptidase MepM/ murein hydrolase activator NlpD
MKQMKKLLNKQTKQLKKFKVYRRAKKQVIILDNTRHEMVRLVRDRRFAGHPISRVLRRFFEFKRIRTAFGLQMVAAVLAVNFVVAPNQVFGFNQSELTHISPELTSMTTEASVRVPLAEFKVNQGYSAVHRGVDLHGSLGDPVYPIMNGKIEAIYYGNISYGNHVIVDHGSGVKSLYAHLSKISVSVNQEVDKNTVIGNVGTTGWSTGPHLHLEVYDQGENINPLSIIKPTEAK